jgi:hypothetical protein
VRRERGAVDYWHMTRLVAHGKHSQEISATIHHHLIGFRLGDQRGVFAGHPRRRPFLQGTRQRQHDRNQKDYLKDTVNNTIRSIEDKNSAETASFTRAVEEIRRHLAVYSKPEDLAFSGTAGWFSRHTRRCLPYCVIK